MSYIELLLLSAGLAMDAFAVSICAGLAMARATAGKALIAGLYFGAFQAGMPVLGYLVAARFADRIIAYDHWIAFGLLAFLGGKMIYGSLQKDDGEEIKDAPMTPARMLPLALATSIDALAVGVSFAFLRVNIVQAVTMIGAVTLALSMLGVKLGSIFGEKFKSKAEFAGGAVLVLIGAKILLEHLRVIAV